jgi:ribonuclease T2
VIRPARRDDAGGIAAIWNHVIRDTTQTFATAEKDPEALAVQIIDQPCFVAEAAGVVVGFVIYGQFRSGPGYAHTMEHSIHVAEGARGAGLGWGLHGLWPQYEQGWPSYCRTSHRDPTRAETSAMGQFMGSSGLAWHQWQKHGRCSGLSAQDYFVASARAMGKVKLPDVFNRLTKAVRIDALVVEEAFLEVNPALRRDMITVTCKSGAVQEVRICLSKDLEPRRCGADVIRYCTLKGANLAPIR